MSILNRNAHAQPSALPLIISTQRRRFSADARRVQGRVRGGRSGNIARRRPRQSMPADGPGATSLGRQDAFGDRNLLFLGG